MVGRETERGERERGERGDGERESVNQSLRLVVHTILGIILLRLSNEQKSLFKSFLNPVTAIENLKAALNRLMQVVK